MTSHQHGCCCFVSRSYSAQVAPAPDSNTNIFEIRPKRHLRIQHLNPRPRDERFEKEMQMFMEYRRHGMAPHVLTAVRPRHTEKVKSPVNTHEKQQTFHPDNIQNVPVIALSDGESGINRQHDSNVQTNIKYQSQVSGNLSNNHHKSISDKSDKLQSSGQSTDEQSRDFSLPLNNESSLPPSRSSNRVQSVQSVSNVHVNVPDGRPKRPSTHPLNTQHAIEEKEEQETPRSSQNSHNKKSHSDPLQTDTNCHMNLKLEESPKRKSSNKNLESVIFFIHGVGGASDIWVSQLKYFSSLGYEIVCPDLIGHGLSSAPDDRKAYHFDEILEDVEVIFDKFCKKSNVVVGHSYGCAFATILARKRARRVSKLVLVSGGAPIPLAPQPGIFSLPLCLLNCLTPCISCTFKRNAFHSKSDLQVPIELAFDIPAYVLSYVMNGQEWPDGDEVYHNWVTVSTLLIYGEQDRFITLEDEEEMLQAIFGSRLDILQNAGHMVMIEAAEKFNESLQQFIEEEFSDSEVYTNQSERNDHVTSHTEQTTSVECLDEANQMSDKSKAPSETLELSAPPSNRGRSSRARYGSAASESSYKSAKSGRSTKSMPRGLLSHHVK